MDRAPSSQTKTPQAIARPDSVITHMCGNCGKNYCYRIQRCNANLVVGGILVRCESDDIVPVGADY